MRTATFYPDGYPGDVAIDASYVDADQRISRGHDLHTTQMCLLNDPRVKTYDLIRIVWHDYREPYDVIEIRYNGDGTYDCDRTDRRLRRVNHLFHLWENGEFGWPPEERL